MSKYDKVTGGLKRAQPSGCARNTLSTNLILLIQYLYMFNLIIRALYHPVDYFPFFHKHTLTLSKIIQESTNIYSFVFTVKEPLVWKAGQHGVFYFPQTKVKGKRWRAFSIASASHEGVIRISTIITENPSDFKKNLLQLEQGSQLFMRGPFGEFHTTKKTKRIVGIAGGIGITPFRALITDIASDSIPHTALTLIYSAVGPHTYQNEFAELLPHKNINIIYTSTPEEVTTELAHQVAIHKNQAHYFISGSPKMISSLRTSLVAQGIKRRRIVNDSFKGY